MSKYHFSAILLISALFSLILISPVESESRTVSVTIANPDGPLVNSQVTFYIPFGLAPVNLSENMTWNESSRELLINLGGFEALESKIVTITLDGPAGRYLVNGKVTGRWPATQNLPEEAFEELIDNFPVTLGSVSAPTVGDFFRDLRSIPELVQFSENVAKPASAVLAVGGVGAVVNSAASASASFAAGMSKFFSYLGLGFLRFRKRKPWGRVYNHLTGKPIEGATVKVIDARFKKIKETQVTDSEGRFGFLISPGEYYLRISRNGFMEKETQVVKVLGPVQALNLEIPLEPLQEILPQKSYKILKITHALLDALNKISPWILAIGAILSIVSILLTPSVLSYIVAGLYGALIILKIILHKRFFKSFGWVLEKEAEKTVDLAVVRIFDANKNWLLGTRVTDHDGRFNFLIGPGDYYVTAAKEGYKPFQSATTHFTKHGLISYDIKLEKQ